MPLVLSSSFLGGGWGHAKEERNTSDFSKGDVGTAKNESFVSPPSPLPCGDDVVRVVVMRAINRNIFDLLSFFAFLPFPSFLLQVKKAEVRKMIADIDKVRSPSSLPCPF